MTGKLLRVNVAAKMLGVSYRTIYRLIDSGELRALNVSTKKQPRYRVYESSIEQFIRKKTEE